MSSLETLEANVKSLNPSDQTFAYSLLSAAKRRPLSYSQATWVQKLAERATADTSTNKAELFSGVRAMFDRNVEAGAKKLAVRLLTESGNKLRVSLASDKVRLHFSEVSTEEDGIGFEGRYFGFIDSNGEFRPSRTACEEEAMKALRELDANPKEVAISYGIKTGTCCVCGRGLTNKVSVMEGIGPICGSRLG